MKLWQGKCQTKRRECGEDGVNRHHQFRNGNPSPDWSDPKNMQWLCHSCHHTLGHNRFNHTIVEKWPDQTNGMDGDGLRDPLIF